MRLKVIKILLNKIPILNDNLINLILKEYWNLLEKKKILKDWIPLDKVSWSVFARNKNAISILENNLDKIDWKYLSYNQNAISILEKNQNKINWNYLSQNRNAIHL